MEDAKSSPLSPAVRRALEDIYRQAEREIDATGVACLLSGRCCDFRKTDHRLFASSLEIAYARAKHPEPFPSESVLCPFWKEGLCMERERRPLGCRTYFCDPRFRDETQAIYERHHAAIAELAERHDIPYRYEPFVEALRGSREGC